jgi:hypothetical protein
MTRERAFEILCGEEDNLIDYDVDIMVDLVYASVRLHSMICGKEAAESMLKHIMERGVDTPSDSEYMEDYLAELAMKVLEDY